MMKQSALGRCIVVGCALSLTSLGSLQTSFAGPTDQICFEEGCCYIGARNASLNCSPGTIQCAEHLESIPDVQYYSFDQDSDQDSIDLFPQRPVGSIYDCPLPLEAYDSSFVDEIKIDEALERLRVEMIAERRLREERYNNCLTGHGHFEVVVGDLGFPNELHGPNELDRLLCGRLASTNYELHNLRLENAVLARDKLRLSLANDELQEQVARVESENTELKKLWSIYVDWVQKAGEK